MKYRKRVGKRGSIMQKKEYIQTADENNKDAILNNAFNKVVVCDIMDIVRKLDDRKLNVLYSFLKSLM